MIEIKVDSIFKYYLKKEKWKYEVNKSLKCLVDVKLRAKLF